jgi:release factor glutamine methyltransferase
MTDVRAALAEGAAMIGERGEAEHLLVHALDTDRAWLFGHALDTLDGIALSRYRALLERRAAGEPIAYIVGSRGFWSMQLEVTPATLIPRPETELLVELALQHLPTDAACDVADLGTGSGAVALAIAAERPQAHVLATDASPDALAVARRNAARLEIDNVRFAEGDWCAALGDACFDLIVSNPPYIATGDAHLAQGDLRFEPAAALASGVDGLDAIRVIVRDACAHLRHGGWLLFEHGWGQGASTRVLLQDAGYAEIFTAQDLESRDRVSGGRVA